MFDLKEGRDYKVIGEPTSEADARALAQQSRDEFQKWAIGLIPRARPFRDKKGADTGIDGVLYFIDDPTNPSQRVVIQVKSGRVGVKDIRDFRGVVERENATFPPLTGRLQTHCVSCCGEDAKDISIPHR